MNPAVSGVGTDGRPDHLRHSELPLVYVDVTNTLSVKFTTGIQRSVKEILKRLPQDDSRTFETVLIARTSTGWRYLADDERGRLLTLPQRSIDLVAPSSPALKKRIARRATRVSKHRRLRPLRSRYDKVDRRLRQRRRRQLHTSLGGVDFVPGSLFFDMEANWHADNRGEVLAELRQQGLRTGALVYDTLPVERPEWFDATVQAKFERHLAAHLEHSDFFGVISDHVGNGLGRLWALRHPDGEPIEPITVRLGADFPAGRPTRPRLPKHINRFVLCVGTIEPRKNHDALLDAFDRILMDELDPVGRAERSPEMRGLSLILVGKQGWDCADTIRRIRSHPALGRRVFWFPNLNDAQLRWLYRSACTVVMPSFDEGLGLPVLEGLASGCITLAADSPSLVEAGGSAADYFDPNDPEALAVLIERSIIDQEYRDERRRAIAHFQPPTWDQATVDVMKLLDSECAATAEKAALAAATSRSVERVGPTAAEPSGSAR